MKWIISKREKEMGRQVDITVSCLKSYKYILVQIILNWMTFCSGGNTFCKEKKIKVGTKL